MEQLLRNPNATTRRFNVRRITGLISLVFVIGLVMLFSRYSRPEAELNPEVEATRVAFAEQAFPWMIGFAVIVFPCMMGVAYWLAKWAKILPSEPFPKATYWFAGITSIICAALGGIHAVNNGLNVIGVALLTGIAGLMFGGCVGVTFVRPRDAAKGAGVGFVLWLGFCILNAHLRLRAGKPLWDREAWEGRSIFLVLDLLIGANFGMILLRVRRYKREMAAGTRKLDGV